MVHARKTFSFGSLFVSFLVMALLAGCVISPRRDTTGTVSGTGSSNFTLSLSPTTTSVNAGGAAAFTITVTATNGFTGTVNLSVTGVPSTMQASLSNNSITGGTGSATLTVSTASTAASGNSTVSVTGTEQDNGSTQVASATVTVTSATGANAQTSVDCVSGLAGQPEKDQATAAPANDSFIASFDATASTVMNGSINFSGTTQASHSAFATLVNFASSGILQARDGEIFTAATNIPYLAGKTYHFRLEVNAPAQSYSVFVTPPGGAEQTLGSHLSFPSDPTDQSVIQAAQLGVLTSSSQGTLKACSLQVQ
jgi:hypothetical protein